jgi:hypothetical protein
MARHDQVTNLAAPCNLLTFINIPEVGGGDSMLSRTDHAQMVVSLGARRALLLAASAVFVVASLVRTTDAAPVTAQSKTRESATQWHKFFGLASICVTHTIALHLQRKRVAVPWQRRTCCPTSVEPPCVASNEQPLQSLPVITKSCALQIM